MSNYINNNYTSNPLFPITAHDFLAAEIIQEIKSDRCIRLEYEKLSAMLELVLDNQEVINILRKTPIIRKEIEDEIVYFDTAYRTHIIEKKKNFVLMTPMHSLTVSWLFYLYH
jgi:hypothetical protein